jgi:hypothetical protein
MVFIEEAPGHQRLDDLPLPCEIEADAMLHTVVRGKQRPACESAGFGITQTVDGLDNGSPRLLEQG